MFPITGSSTFSVREVYKWRKWSGTFVEGRRAGTERYWPVMGGCRPSSRERRARTAAMLPPADDPPTIRPLVGVALRSDEREIAHLRASQQSCTPVGKGCSGASLIVLSMYTHAWLKEKRGGLLGWKGNDVPVLHINSHNPQFSNKHPTIHVFVC
jgi:hypothetical protein